MIIPAKILKTFELTKKNCPINVAVEPNAMKTKENPKVKKIVLINIKFLFFLLFCQMMFLKYRKYIQELKVVHMATKS